MKIIRILVDGQVSYLLLRLDIILSFLLLTNLIKSLGPRDLIEINLLRF